MSSNQKPKKKKTFFGRLLKGIGTIGKKVSPNLLGLITDATGLTDVPAIEHQLAKEGFDDNELKFLLAELDKDKQELIEITKRWQSDNKDGSWLARNVRPATLVIYNLSLVLFIFLDSYVEGFEVKNMWINILLSNTGIVNTAYFGSRYLEKRDKKRNE